MDNSDKTARTFVISQTGRTILVDETAWSTLVLRGEDDMEMVKREAVDGDRISQNFLREHWRWLKREKVFCNICGRTLRRVLPPAFLMAYTEDERVDLAAICAVCVKLSDRELLRRKNHACLCEKCRAEDLSNEEETQNEIC